MTQTSFEMSLFSGLCNVRPFCCFFNTSVTSRRIELQFIAKVFSTIFEDQKFTFFTQNSHQNLVAYFTNQGVETPCYRTSISKATAFSCEHPRASYFFCQTENCCFLTSLITSKLIFPYVSNMFKIRLDGNS